MNAPLKLKLYNSIRVFNQLMFTFIIVCALALGVYLLVRANEDVADYKSLKVAYPTAEQISKTSRNVVVIVAGTETSYEIKWRKNVAVPGDIYRSWLRMKYVGGKWVRDTKYPPILASASFRAGRGVGDYTQRSNVPAPDKPGFYVFELRAEYDRVSGAEPSIDVRQSNVVEVQATTALDPQIQIDALRDQLNELSQRYNSAKSAPAPIVRSQPQAIAPNNQAIPTPTPSQAPLPTPSPSPSVRPATTPRPCVIGLLGLCILGTR